MRFTYQPDGPVLNRFFWDNDEVTIIQGPIGSGTSTACCMKMLRLAMAQKPDRAGVRRTRWLVIRNTFEELKGTTLKTWRMWFEEVAEGIFGEVKMTNPPEHNIKWTMPDGTTLDMEVMFLSLDQDEDVRKLLSREPTGVWFNEVQFAGKSIFDAAHSRVILGRYPPKMFGGPTWKGVIADLNAPPEGHWIPYMRGDIPLPDDWDDDERRQYTKPEGWNFYVQPPGLLEIIKDGKVVGYEENSRANRIARSLPDLDAVAENTKHLTESYMTVIKAKPKSFIDTFVMNRVGFYRAGKPVYESFRPEIHVAKEPIEYQKEWPLIVGIDFARNPAMAVCQLIRGAFYQIDEFGCENMAATTYAPLFRQRLLRKFPEAFTKDAGGIRFYGDPTGGNKGQGTDQTPFMIFQANGMNVVPAPGNNSIDLRINAVQSQLDKMVDGGPGLLISPTCRVTKAGMGGGYHYAKIKGRSQYHEVPDKSDRFADFCDAQQYAALGAGLGTAVLIGKNETPKAKKVERKRFSLRRRR